MNSKPIPFSEVPVNAAFTVRKAEVHGGKFGMPVREVSNSSTYIKKGQSHSVDIHSNKDCIFTPSTPCKIIKANAV